LTLAVASVLTSTTRDATTRRELKTVTEIQGFSCAARYAWFFTDGTLSSCFVSRETKFGKIVIPENSMILLSREGAPRFVFLSRETNLNGYPCRGGPAHDYNVALYPGGELKTCWLAEDHVVDDVPCMRAGFFADVFGGGVETDLHPNGRLQGCKVSRDFTYQGRAFRRGDHIRLDSEGKVNPM
jgi:hypothetical protein